MEKYSLIALVCLLSSSVAELALGVEYKFTDIGASSPSLTDVRAEGINNAGQVVGSATNKAFVYSGGFLQVLQVSSSITLTGYAINNLGQVVGTATLPPIDEEAYLYSGGSFQALGILPGGHSSNAYGINDSGQVAGTSLVTGNASHAFRLTGGTMQDLGLLPNGQDSDAAGINNSGQVVGNANVLNGGSYTYAFLDDSGGSMQSLGTFPGYSDSYANAINNNGVIVGYCTSGATSRAFLDSGGVMTNLGVLPGNTNSVAEAINDFGQIVGQSYGGGSNGIFLESGGSMESLGPLISGDSGWTLNAATGINDAGQIVGYGTNPSGQTDAFLLTPTPEPPTLSLLGLGGVVLFGYAWRQRRWKRSSSLAEESVHSSDDECPVILSLPSRRTESARRAA